LILWGSIFDALSLSARAALSRRMNSAQKSKREAISRRKPSGKFAIEPLPVSRSTYVQYSANHVQGTEKLLPVVRRQARSLPKSA
jgi:hypothetical protein